MSGEAVDPATFRAGLARFATGVTVVTSRHGDNVHGMTANSFCSVSLNPPLVLFCPKRGTRTWQMIIDSGYYTVNVLQEDQRELCAIFAGQVGDEADRYRGLEYTPAPLTGCPVFPGSLAAYECRVVNRHDAGDHSIMVAEVMAIHLPEAGQPLVFFDRQYRSLRDIQVAEKQPG